MLLYNGRHGDGTILPTCDLLSPTSRFGMKLEEGNGLGRFNKREKKKSSLPCVLRTGGRYSTFLARF